jgi:hypothetical protein
MQTFKSFLLERSTELIAEAAVTSISASDFKIEEADGKYKVSVNATGGPLISAMRSLAFAPDSRDTVGEDDDAYDKLVKSGAKFGKIASSFTVSGRPLAPAADRRTFGAWEKFKAKSCLFKIDPSVKDPIKEIKTMIDAVVEYQNHELKYQADWKAGAEDRKKSASKSGAATQKARLAKLAELYGKETIGRVKIKQIGGDDGYQYNVIVDGRSIMNGLTKSSAEHEREIVWKQLAKKAGLGTYGAKK